jgi:uncharacterized membrane protein (UPF0127 family)
MHVADMTLPIDAPFAESQYTSRQLTVDGRVVGVVHHPRRRSGQRKGLLGRQGLAAATALLLDEPLVHMIGMRFALDLVLLKKDGTIVAVYEAVKPGLRMRGHWRARRTLEIAAGQAAACGMRVGARVNI